MGVWVMAMTNRETVRDGLAALLEANLVPGTCQAVSNHGIAELDEVSHVVVMSTGSGRAAFAMGAQNTSTLFMVVQVWVLYTDGGDWGRDDAEDRLDLIEKGIADLLETNRWYSGYWDGIEYEDRSRVEEVLTVTGTPYLRETIPLELQVVGG